jgi:hypothetical protein
MNILKFLESMNIDPNEYLRLAKKAAKSNGYNPSYLELSDKEKYKLKYKNIYFGATLYRDFLIYTILMKKGQFTEDYINKRRYSYLTRSAGIKGDWIYDKYSKNNLARNILW